MEKKKRQRIKDGAIVKIKLTDDRMVFARLMVGKIAVYDFVAMQSNPIPETETIIGNPVIFYSSVYNDVITKGLFEIIGFKALTRDEIDQVPPVFTQDLVNIDDCTISYQDGRQLKGTPDDCIGLERLSVWEASAVTKRIEDHYGGKRNFYVELDKPILSKDDPRYLPPPKALRWDFDKGEFYRTDK